MLDRNKQIWNCLSLSRCFEAAMHQTVKHSQEVFSWSLLTDNCGITYFIKSGNDRMPMDSYSKHVEMRPNSPLKLLMFSLLLHTELVSIIVRVKNKIILPADRFSNNISGHEHPAELMLFLAESSFVDWHIDTTFHHNFHRKNRLPSRNLKGRRTRSETQIVNLKVVLVSLNE